MLNPGLEFCMSACVTEMRGDYNFEKRCKTLTTREAAAAEIM